MAFSFKKFIEFVDAPDISEEQLSEIFGEFSNAKRVDKLRADREALRAKKVDPKADAKAKDAAWAKAKNNVGNGPQKSKDDGEEEIDSKLKDKVWMKAKSRIERRAPEFATESKAAYTSAVPDSNGKFAVDKERMNADKARKNLPGSSLDLKVGGTYKKLKSMAPTWAVISALTDTSVTFTDHQKKSGKLVAGNYADDKLSIKSFIKQYSTKSE